MTAQIGDIYRYRKKKYTIVALSSVVPFKPQDYGLESHMSSTACYRGYWCEYEIIDDELILKDLYLFNKDDNYPPLNGVEVSPLEFIDVECHSSKKKKKEKATRPSSFDNRLYKDVNLPISYTGKKLLGNDFMHEYYIHMGFQRGWAYKELIELVFEQGLLIESNNLSHIAKAQREAMKKQKVDPEFPYMDHIPKFVENSFSLEYSDKAWWIKDNKK